MTSSSRKHQLPWLASGLVKALVSEPCVEKSILFLELAMLTKMLHFIAERIGKSVTKLYDYSLLNFQSKSANMLPDFYVIMFGLYAFKRTQASLWCAVLDSFVTFTRMSF